uniref:MATH domain-containing protein n=2 Tax=Parascaris univalens TaxID=6257 RepID=A0A915AAT5_PARUN
MCEKEESANKTPAAISNGACCSRVSNDDDHVTFQYEWPVKVCKRRVSQNEELVLNVSPAFSTALDGVQFTWALKISDDCAASDYYYEDNASNISVSLYYKDGPTPDVHVVEAKIQITDVDGENKLPTLRFLEDEWTRGSGWSAKVADQRHTELSNFVHEHVGKTIRVIIDIKMESSIFSPMLYLPNVDGANKKLEDACVRYLEDVRLNHKRIPQLESILNDPEMDMFEVHDLILSHGCDEIQQRTKYKWERKHIQNVFTHIYFMQCVLPGIEYFEDFIEVIDASRSHCIAPLTREIERYICRTIIKSTKDLTFIKKMLLVAEHNELPVLKMMCSGIIADSIVDESAKDHAQMNAISREMRQIAQQIALTESESATEEVDNDILVNNIMAELKSLTRSMRRVSISKSTKSSNSSRSTSPCVMHETSDARVVTSGKSGCTQR